MLGNTFPFLPRFSIEETRLLVRGNIDSRRFWQHRLPFRPGHESQGGNSYHVGLLSNLLRFKLYSYLLDGFFCRKAFDGRSTDEPGGLGVPVDVCGSFRPLEGPPVG